jgi:NAD(P)-dependent dehydrogenase (short-subunit alcohol dehydrogenase family)
MGLLEGRVAIVTGAGSGIGKATALRMSQEGAKMVVVDIVPDAGKATLATIKERGAEGIFIETDVTNFAQVERMVDTVKYNYGQINILHNNVGVGGSKAAHDTTEENWDRIINGCLKSVYLCCRTIIPLMLKNDGGKIVNTASATSSGFPKRLIGCLSIRLRRTASGSSREAKNLWCVGVDISLGHTQLMRIPRAE